MEGCLGVRLDALDHRGEAIGALLGEVTRKPELAQHLTRIGGEDLAGRLEAKALYSASLLWGWAWEGDAETGKGQGPFAVITVDGDMPPPASSDAGGQSTLGLDDLVPPWRGPAKEG